MAWTGNRNLLSRVLNPSPTRQTRSQIPKALEMIPANAKVVDLGAGGRKITPTTITVDFTIIGETSVVADIHRLPFISESIGGVFCTGTLEHVEYPEKAVQEIERVLTKGGIAYIDVPFMQCFHPDPVDYWRFTIKGLELICQRTGLSKIASGANIGTASALTWILMAFFESLFVNDFANRVFSKLTTILVAPIKFLDNLTLRGHKSTIGPSAVYFIGIKQ